MYLYASDLVKTTQSMSDAQYLFLKVRHDHVSNTPEYPTE